MSLETPARRASNTSLVMLLVGLVGGAASTLFFSGYLPGFERQAAVPEANLASGEPGAQNTQGPRGIDHGTGGVDAGAREEGPVQIPAADTGQTTTATSDPLASEALRAILERRTAEEARLRERAQLASESPLTPPATNIAERIQAWKEEQAARDRPASGDAGSGAAAQSSPDFPGVSDPASSVTTPPAHLLARGSVIPSVLETALDSDLPGLVRARVSRDVYDTLTGFHVLIPRGAQLVGTYGESARGGQRRLFVTWTDLRLPDGTPIDLGEFSTLGADGAAGVKGKRRTGLLAALGAAVLFDLAGNATQILTGTETQEEADLGALIAGATGNATSRVAERYMDDLVGRGPRFRVKAGTIMNVLVEEDMTLPAQGGVTR